MQTVVPIEPAQQSLRLGSHEAELNRIDTAILAAAKGKARLPTASKIFDALIEASNFRRHEEHGISQRAGGPVFPG